VLTDLRRLGQERQADLYFAEWCAPADAGRDDPETWRIASPSFGVIQKERDVRRMLAKATTPAARALFDADVLGWGDWPPDESQLGSAISAEVWDALADPEPELVGPITVAVDRTPDRKQWSIAAAQRTTDGRVHIEVGPYEGAWSNTDVVTKLEQIVCEWDPITLTVDQRSAAAVIQPLLAEVNIEGTYTNATDLALACGGFLDAVTASAVSHSNQPALNDAVASAVKRELPAGFAWNRSAGGPVSALVAATLAHWSLLAFSPAARPKLTALPMTPKGDDDQLDLMTVKF
jgi:hypothetical protein